MKSKNKNSKIFSREGAKKLFKPFILLFLVNFLIINWSDISWMFNYKVISGIVSDFFEKISSKSDNIAQLEETDYFNKENSLEIPKIGVLAPLIIVEDSNEKDFDKELDEGVIFFPSSALPGQAGQTIILGHSAHSNWPKVKYDWVFSRLNELEEKDEINFYFNHQKYTYYVKKKSFLRKGEEIPNGSTYSENTLLLISCWPPGENFKRIIVEATLNKT